MHVCQPQCFLHTVLLLTVVLCGWCQMGGEAVELVDQLMCIQDRLVVGDNGDGTQKAQFEALAGLPTIQTFLKDALSFAGDANMVANVPFTVFNTLLSGSKGHYSTMYERCEFRPSFTAAWYFDLEAPEGGLALVQRVDAVMGCLTRVLHHASNQRDVLWSFNISGETMGCFAVHSQPVAPAETDWANTEAIVEAYFTKAVAIPASTNLCAESYGSSSIIFRTEMECPSIPLWEKEADTYRCLGNCVPHMDHGACCGVPGKVGPIEEVGEVPPYFNAVEVLLWFVVVALLLIVVVVMYVVCRAVIKRRSITSTKRTAFTGDFATAEVAEATASALVLGLPVFHPPAAQSSKPTVCGICSVVNPPANEYREEMKQLACGHVFHARCLRSYICTKVRFSDALQCPECKKDMFETGM